MPIYTDTPEIPEKKRGRGRPKGSKNVNPYPITDKVRERFILNGLKGRGRPNTWQKGIPHTYETREKMHLAAIARIEEKGVPWHMAYKGTFKCKNPSKYKGDFQNIIFRSLWERRAFVWADENPQVLEWNSEETIIPYFDKSSGRMRRYFPDMWLKVRASDGSIRSLLWEIKPLSQVKEPEPKSKEQLLTESGRRKRIYYTSVMTYAKNVSKWDAAREYCKTHGMTFHIITEKQLEALSPTQRKK